MPVITRGVVMVIVFSSTALLKAKSVPSTGSRYNELLHCPFGKGKLSKDPIPIGRH